MTSLSDAIPTGTPRRGKAASLKLAAAYRGVFSANATKDEAEIVRADLAVFCKMFDAMAPDVSNDVLRVIEGRRSVYRMIMGYLALSERDLLDLQSAAALEAQVNDAELMAS
mgnify:CR=1 FL=1